MGNIASWLAQCIYPDEQVLWQAARSGDAHTLRAAIAKLTPETRKYMEWQEPCSGRAALAEAALRGHCDCVVLLVGAGANCNAKDYRGNTPLHLACKRGKDDVVQYLLQVPNVFPFETNLDTLTPLDLVRKKILKHESCSLSFERCLEELEKKFCVYSGWLYEERDNMLSMVSGISSLSSWKRRFCIVLERGAPDILELALFSMKPCGMRPVCPSSVILYQVGAGMAETTDTKWFNRKDFAFSIRGNRKENCHYDSTIVMEPLQFAAVDQAGYDAWKCFFEHQRQSLHARATSLYGQPVVMLNRPPHALQQGHRTASVVALPTAEQYQYQVPSAQRVVTYDRSESKPAAAAPLSSYPAFAAVTSQEQEEADLRRAIWLSLQTTGNCPSDPLEPAASPALPVSAPDWDDGDDSASLHSASASDGASSPAAAPAAAAAPTSPLVNFGRAPSYSSIGECIICFDGPQAAVCVPCGHNAVCMSCAEEILETSCECPVCRTPIRELIKLYRV